MIPEIDTPRLRLVSMSVECLEAFLAGDREKAELEGGFAIAEDCSLMKKSWVGHRLKMIEEDPKQHPWLYRAIVRKSDNAMIGYINFHHKAPDPDLLEYSDNAAELGYTIEPAYRKNGYAKESAVAMMNWANGQKVETFVLSVSPSNIASLSLAKSMGFKNVSERMDEIDGLEFVFTADIDAVRRSCAV